MKLTFNASGLALALMSTLFFGCKDQLYDAQQEEPTPATAVVSPADETTTTPDAKWWKDASIVPLPESDGRAIDPSFKRGNSKPRIVVIGSATAEGVGASQKSLSWVELMKSKLKKDKKDVSVINLAQKKFTTYHIMPSKNKVTDRPLSRLGHNITAALEKKPFLVIVHLTTTDVHNGYTDEEILNNYDVIYQKLIAENVNFLFTGTQPRNFSKANRDRLAKLNDKLKAKYPNNFVDVLKKLSLQDYKIKTPYAFTDGRNLTDAGHAVVNGYVFNAPLFKQLLGYK